MQITLIAYGTRGDVQPALAIGCTLRARGHNVKLLASAHYKAWIERYGLAAVPAKVDMQAVMAGGAGSDWAEQGTQPLKQLQIMKRLLAEHGPALMADAWQGVQGSDLILSSFTSMAYAPAMAEALGARHALLLLQPPLLPTRSGPAMMNAPLPDRESWVNYRVGQWLMEPLVFWTLAKVVNDFRRAVLGRPAQNARQNAADWQRGRVLLGYSRHVAPPAADWPATVRQTGYWFLDEAAGWTPPARLTDFLAAGEAPVCLGFGSMGGRDQAAFQQVQLDALARSGRRAILLAGWGGAASDDLPRNVLALEAAPHDWLFPRVAAVVHHGGAGTSAAAFRAGVPQVVVPHLADQPFWGARVEMLGVGPAPIPRPKLTTANLAAAIQAATGNAGMRQRAAALSESIKAEDGVTAAVDLIEAA